MSILNHNKRCMMKNKSICIAVSVVSIIVIASTLALACPASGNCYFCSGFYNDNGTVRSWGTLCCTTGTCCGIQPNELSHKHKDMEKTCTSAIPDCA